MQRSYKLKPLIKWIDKNTSLVVLIAVALVFLVRVSYFFVRVYPIDQIAQPDGYWEIAESLLNGRGYRYDAYMADKNVITAKRGPTTVFFFLLLFAIFGVKSWPILIAQWALDAATGWMMYQIARVVFPRSKYVGLLAVLMYAFYLPELSCTVGALSEPLFTFLLAWYILSLLKALQKASMTRFAFSGFLLGLAHHSRPTMSAFPLVVLILFFLKFKKDRSVVVKGFATFSIVFASVLLPWVVRNYIVFQTFIPGTTLLGYNVYWDFRGHLEVQNLIYDESGRPLVDEELALGVSDPYYLVGKSEAELDKLWLSTAWELIKLYPSEYTKWCFNNFSRMWFGIGRPRWHTHHELRFSYVTVMNAVILLMGFTAYVVYRGSWVKSSLPLLFLIIYLTAIHTLAFGSIRYSVPVIPHLLILSAYSLLRIGQVDKTGVT